MTMTRAERLTELHKPGSDTDDCLACGETFPCTIYDMAAEVIELRREFVNGAESVLALLSDASDDVNRSEEVRALAPGLGSLIDTSRSLLNELKQAARNY